MTADAEIITTYHLEHVSLTQLLHQLAYQTYKNNTNLTLILHNTTDHNLP